MRTRSQLSAWAQAKQLAIEQQLAFREFERQQLLRTAVKPAHTSTPRKRKLQVATSDVALVASIPTAPLFTAASTTDETTAGKRSILDYISPNPKKAKLEEQTKRSCAAYSPEYTVSQATAATAATAQTLSQSTAFKTPMKKRQLYVDTRRTEDVAPQSTAIATECLGEPKSILDYISPNSKKAQAESTLQAAASEPTAAAATVLLTKRPSIRRTLSYGSSEEVFSDASIETLDDVDDHETVAALSVGAVAAKSDTERILHRICSSRGGQRTLPLVGRAAEQAAIASVLNVSSVTAANAECSPNLFIIGPPGTGKSSSVHQLLAEYEQRFPANVVVRVNCSMFTNPVALYAEVDAQLRRLSPWKLPYLDPCLLDEFLQDANRARYKCETVLVLDEVDQLLRLPPVTQKRVQDVLRFLVRWSALPAAKVKFLGIMNGLDMHAQFAAFLPQEIVVPHVLFPAYTFSELLVILQSHVQVAADECRDVDDLVEQRALELIARKVASRDGDVRRATSLLQQCARFCLRRSSECASAVRDTHKITLRDVLACTSAMLAAGPVRDVHQLPRLPKILLFAITSLAPSGGKACDMVAVSKELARLRAMPAFTWIPSFPRDELQVHLASLECYALVKRPPRASSKAFWSAKLTSAVTLDIVDRAIQDDPLLSMLTRGVANAS